MTLRSRINHGWRWIATAISFFLFGIGGIFISIFFIPALYFFSATPAIREERGKRVIHHSFRLFIWVMETLGVLTYRVSGIDKLDGAKLIVANHPSLIDTIFLIALTPNTSCVVKSTLLRNPFMWGPIKTAGYVVNKGSAEEVIDAAADAFQKGFVLIIFPEGTRTVPLQPLTMKRGAANIAIRTGVDITPILIECKPTTLTKADHWYQVPDERVHISLQVRDRISIAPYLEGMNPSLASRMLTSDLNEFFSKEIRLHE